jgi:hypothetical protein
VADSPWSEPSRKAIEWSFRQNHIAFCTECSAKLQARREGQGADVAWVLKCGRCGRGLRFRVEEGQARDG